jgi:hypothetical protein
MASSSKVGISLYIDFETLSAVEKNVSGKNRSIKLEKCIKAGYPIAIKTPL